MTGRSDRPGCEPEDPLELLARAAVAGVSRRQLVKLGGALALSALLPEWAVPARATNLAQAAKTVVRGPCPPQSKQACDAVRATWQPGCRRPVAKGKASEFNGCGPEAGLDLPVLGHGDWIPDRPLGLANFFDACKGHDCCYGQCGSQKSDCDSNFMHAMTDACAPLKVGAALPPFGGLAYVQCLGVAAAYHAAVADTDTGQGAYNAGQAEVCDCCETYMVTFDSVVTLAPAAGSSFSGGFQFEYTAQIPLTTPADGSVYASGSAQGVYAQASGAITQQTDDGPFVWTLNDGAGALMQVVDFELGDGSPTITLTVAAPLEDYTITAPKIPAQNFEGPFWVDVFVLMENVNYSDGQIKLALTPGSGATELYSGPVAHGEFVHSADVGTLNGGPAVDLTATEHTTVTVTAQ